MPNKINKFLFFLAVCLLCLHPPAYAFHNGSVAECQGCHTMHNSKDGAVVATGGGLSSALIVASDPSSVCLNCHSGTGSFNNHHVSSPDGSAMTPGGDFYWLKKTFAWAGGSSPGNTHGHNIVALDYGFTADAYRNNAPWGSYPAASLGCSSCHDPHGSTNGGTANSNPPVSGSGSYGEPAQAGTTRGNYRLLGGTGYNGGNASLGFSFSNDAPIARQNSIRPFGETDTSHVDYGSNMSEWCANCHTDILTNKHQNSSSNFEHPSGNNEDLGDYINTYNSYVKTGDMSGIRDTAYFALIPFERGESDATTLDPAGTSGPDSASNIMCLTCHRAHASAFKFMGRWDFGAELVIDSHPAAIDAGVTGNDILYSFYGRDMVTEFGASQRILCEKCHQVPKEGYPVF
jgi:hypothetical protein